MGMPAQSQSRTQEKNQNQEKNHGQRKNTTVILVPLLILLTGGSAAVWWIVKGKRSTPQQLPAPTGLTASVTQSGTQMNVHMGWNQVPGATSYTWEVLDSSGNVVARGQVSGTSTDTTLPAGGSYSFHVQACA